MLTQELMILIITAASIGFFHTLLGPDHYLPFVVMARAGKWSLVKTTWITVLCGIGHILSSVLLGIIGITLGIAVSKLEAMESFRAGFAAWALITFGLVYFIWGLNRVLRNRPHQHWHIHGEGNNHLHRHVHTKEHLHVHEAESGKNYTPWLLFTIFIFGPCEPLIPILMYPAANGSLLGLVLVTGVFGGVTIITMLSVILVSSLGVNLLPMGQLERYTHVLAGATICLCGLSMQFLGL